MRRVAWATGLVLTALLATYCSEKQPPAQQPANTGQRLAGATSATGQPTFPATPASTAAPAIRPSPEQGQQLTASVSDLNGLISDLGGRQTDAGLVIIFSADVLFDFDKADLKPEARPTLEKLAKVVRKATKSRVLINGYTDAKGDAAYNLTLSQQRAQAIANWLLAHAAGTPGQTHQVKGYGEANPVAPNATTDDRNNPAGRQQNRRVEVVIS